jgi:RHS repeat-associated protein
LPSIQNGNTFGAESIGFPFSFTGEMVDANDLVYLRARYYHPGLGVFTGLDPVEGDVAQAMSLNRYGYVAGNVVNMVDPSGMYTVRSLEKWDPCEQDQSSCRDCCLRWVWDSDGHYRACVDLCEQGDLSMCSYEANVCNTPIPISYASETVQAAWNAAIYQLSSITTGENIGEYTLPSGQAAVDAIATNEVKIYVVRFM